ncbi:MAG: TraB/GumN family protein [Myxococcales bacterium]|nr:TraB/GumN family protein [Myxococcales bacterium]
MQRRRLVATTLPSLLLALVAGAACAKPSTTSAPSVPPVGVAITDVDRTATAPAPTAIATVAKPLFWTATKGDQTVHLLGTIHMGVSADELPASVWEAFAVSKQVAIEANIQDLGLMASMLRKDKRTLQDELGPATWGKLVALLGEKEAMGLTRFKTFVATMRVQMHGLEITPGVDIGVIERANKSSKPLAYLEEGSLQMRLLEKWMTAGVVAAMIDNVGKLKSVNDGLVAAYRAGDEAALLAIAEDDSSAASMGMTEKDATQMEFEMLEQRNQSWIAPIEKLAAVGPAFIAVGAMHLVGDKSVVKMLEARGWKVERQ